MRIESGPTGERKIRSTLLFLMVAGFSSWFAYDGWIGYPKENLREHLEDLPAEERAKAGTGPVYASVREDRLSQAEAATKVFDRKSQAAGLQKLFGGPPTYENKGGWYYFGPTYRIKIGIEDSASTVTGKRAAHKDMDLLVQKGLAAVLGVFAVYLLWLVFRVRSTKFVLDDAGLLYNGRGPIVWDSMKSLDVSRFAQKGWVDLHYHEDGAGRKLRLDEYHLQAFDEAIDEICRRKSFENPLPVKGDKGASSPAAG